MLKPTVGMELRPNVSAGNSGEGAHGGATQARTDTVETVPAVCATWADVDALDSEFAALDGSQSFRPRRSIVRVARACPKRDETHR